MSAVCGSGDNHLQVVVIIHGFYPRIGGAERLVGSISPLLQQRGVGVHILTRRLPGTRPYEEIDGVPVFRLPVPGPKMLASLAFTLAAMPLIACLKPDLIHAHELISPSTTALLAKRLYRCPVIVTLHRSGPLGDVLRMKSRPLGKLRLRALIRSIDRFVVISREIDSELADEGVPPEKRLAISNGVDVRRFFPLDAAGRESMRQRLGLPLDSELVVFAGRLAPEKRLDVLVEVWPQVRRAFPQAHLLLLGNGPQEAALRALAVENKVVESVHFLGSQDRVVDYYQACDVFVLPSAAEGLSIALLEAMACGLPPVATAIGGAPEVIEHGKSGFLIPVDNREALFRALCSLLGDQAQRRAMGDQARQRISQVYALDGIADQLYALYQEVAGIRSNGGAP